MCSNRSSNKLQVSDEILVVSGHVYWFSIQPTAYRFRFPLVTTLIYTKPTVTNKEPVLGILRPCDTDAYFQYIIFSNTSEILFMCITDYIKLFQDAAQSKY